MAESRSFDGIAEEFLGYSQHTRGAIRYQLAHENLSPFVEQEDVQTVLDICGGSGIDAAWFATHGLRVTMLEPSYDQLQLATQRFEKLDHESRRRIAPPFSMDFMDYRTERQFDLVTMHGVAMYQDDPNAYFNKAMSHVKPDGYISVLEKGWGAAAQRAIDTGDPKAIERFNETGRFLNRHGREVTSFTAEELQDTLQALGATVVAVAGVRVVSDHINEKVEDYGQRNFETLLAIERTASKDPHCLGMAQMIHVIARKN